MSSEHLKVQEKCWWHPEILLILFKMAAKQDGRQQTDNSGVYIVFTQTITHIWQYMYQIKGIHQ
jgi:hypothetical protein